MTYRTCFLLLMLGLSGCTYSIHQYHVSDFETVGTQNTKVIKAYSEQFVVLGFVGNTNYVDDAYQKLKRKCRRGRISGITTEWQTAHGFFSWTNKLYLTALCRA
ncbi:hypothetical protein [Pseudobacteriovorax antillogorgiicola]|uniref:Bor protein n=1 Tax=Pseudobacteriovorax antillogorgiicola TaxID=1513793 RepID=A0A1Y6CDZ0_9BACT|nr:hypothetical protein [Pseudobacteriovorax antillogorgiicola]TCS47980.1 hypothetical protein EDD56_11991 [Pseudobacteriovorax antillogorgiicola]SMF58258.1 hypothetical protein SAMN06296036_11992 [Pseudobacteriovorax antillogorgiicola]